MIHQIRVRGMGARQIGIHVMVDHQISVVQGGQQADKILVIKLSRA
jgi:hypothetical protein